MTLTSRTQFTRPSAILILLAGLFHFTKAQTCPPWQTLVYSPFTPYFSPSFLPYLPPSDPNRCWDYSSCFFIATSEPGKQQFAATALVMGFIPLTLKDFPWKRENPLFVSKEPSWWLDILVRALGVIPKKTEEGIGGTKLALYANNPVKLVAVTTGCAAGLLVSYISFALTEIYSKRSALGCVYPVFVLSWWLFALVPAAVESVHQRRNNKKAQSTNSNTLKQDAPRRRRDIDLSKEESIGSALVQFLWAIYGIMGALIYTGIMGVAVIELFVWIMSSVAAAGFSKCLGFLLCALTEKLDSRAAPDRPSGDMGMEMDGVRLLY
ncbi:hypothetical protein GP486_005373 [Trichoglossum hirsutum]|uniref:Autophagy-related protein n=1 Tax=Trichoglossum hirsutum TaxID=265104 RepID=A0A9P8RME0_9PEZI|nr:hypothetical protein GP486_005373 [Trichoglossum hirsutum]